VPAGPCPNYWCRRPDRGFSVVFPVAAHSGALRRAISRYKYRGERTLAPVFAGMVASYLAAHAEWFEEFGVITGVPGYSGPGSRRGWDPVAGVLAELAALLGRAWTVAPGLVVKTRETPGMAGLGWSARQAVARGPLRGALAAAPGTNLAGAQVLVLDDVLTEGGTLREVAAVLRRAGASDVAGLVLARPTWASEPPGGAVPTGPAGPAGPTAARSLGFTP
jgi:predicted amidophosphoribosyltransferase